MISQRAFEEAREAVLGTERRRLGIGTLSEKTVHALLKRCIDPDPSHQEVPLEGYVADIFADGAVTEIQTAQFNKLRGKLEAFLPHWPVTVVYPIPREKWIIWVDGETGACKSRRKSPVRGSVYSAFPELYKIKTFLLDPNLRLKLVLLDVEEYRLLDGKRSDRNRSAGRVDRIPLRLAGEAALDTPDDYRQFIPEGLAEPFTSRELAEAARIRLPLAQIGAHILCHVGVLERSGKRGRLTLYREKERL